MERRSKGSVHDSTWRLQSDDFQRWVSISRLLTFSMGAAELTPEIWAKGRDMERAREARVKQSAIVK